MIPFLFTVNKKKKEESKENRIALGTVEKWTLFSNQSDKDSFDKSCVENCSRMIA